MEYLGLAYKFYCLFDGKLLRNFPHSAQSQTFQVCSLAHCVSYLYFARQIANAKPTSLARKPKGLLKILFWYGKQLRNHTRLAQSQTLISTKLTMRTTTGRPYDTKGIYRMALHKKFLIEKTDCFYLVKFLYAQVMWQLVPTCFVGIHFNINHQDTLQNGCLLFLQARLPPISCIQSKP